MSRQPFAASMIWWMGPLMASRISTLLISSAPRQAGGDVLAAYLVGDLLLQRVGAADGYLDLLGGAVADLHAVHVAHVVDDGVVHLVAGDGQRLQRDKLAQAQDGHARGAAADVDDHDADRLADLQPRADGAGLALRDGVDLARAGVDGAVLDGLLLDGRDAAGHADDHARAHAPGAWLHLLDEVAQQDFGDLEVGDDAVLERPDGPDVLRRALDHALGFVADSAAVHGHDGGVAVDLDGDDGGLHQHHALARHADERVGGAQVDAQVQRAHAHDEVEHSAQGLSHFVGHVVSSSAPKRGATCGPPRRL